VKNFIHLSGNLTRGFPACSIVPQPLSYCVPLCMCVTKLISLPESASELYRPRDLRLSEKLVPTFYFVHFYFFPFSPLISYSSVPPLPPPSSFSSSHMLPFLTSFLSIVFFLIFSHLSSPYLISSFHFPSPLRGARIPQSVQ
jgi:hypothetical protein